MVQILPASETRPTGYTAFSESRIVASGDLRAVAAKVKAVLEGESQASVLIFDDVTGGTVEVDFRGNVADVLGRITPPPNGEGEEKITDKALRGPGRPKLGVVAREVTLLPRHWDWLGSQPGGASVALRRLVEDARKVNAGRDRERQVREATYRFISVMAGNEPGFEEATRALFAGDQLGFKREMQGWPVDVREHAEKLASFGVENQ